MPLTTVLVEDSATIRDALIPAMRELGKMEVVAVAETPAEAINAFETFKDTWQIAAVDLFLKQGTGLTVLRALRNRAAHQHVFVLTNYATPSIREQCELLGAEGVFDKSTELETFFERCSALADEPILPEPR